MKYSRKTLNVPSDRGSLVQIPETFSTNFVREISETRSQVADSEIIDAALKILAKRVARGSLLSSPRAAREYLTLRFGEVEQEVFAALYLDKRHRLIACEELFRGTIDGASVHPRIVVKEALRHNAAAMIITHNHRADHAAIEGGPRAHRCAAHRSCHHRRREFIFLCRARASVARAADRF